MLQNEKGHALFYVLIILPILTTLSIIIFDISQWLGTRNALQAQVDRIATLASRSLPNTELAESQIREITSSLSGIKISSDDPFVISANEVRFTLQARNVALFDFLLESAGLPAIVFESKLEARVQILPGDYVIILSDSASLRPKPYEPWGNAQQWPASSYFNFSLPPLESNDKTTPDYSRALWGQDDFRRWATQQCFNPIFSPMKLAAAILADNLQKAANNRVTALFSPGAIVGSPFEQTRILQFADSIENETLWHGNYNASWFSDEVCIYLSDPQQNSSGHYGYPQELGHFGDYDSTCPSAVSSLYLSYHLPGGRVTDCFKKSVSLAERLYYRSSQDREHDSDGSMLNDSIAQSLSIFSYAAAQEQEQQVESRGNLRAIAQRKIIALVDTVPQIDANFTLLLENLEKAKVELTIIYLSHNNLDTTRSHLNDTTIYSDPIKETLDIRFLELLQLTEDFNSLSVYKTENPEDLLTTVLPQLIENTHDISISK